MIGAHRRAMARNSARKLEERGVSPFDAVLERADRSARGPEEPAGYTWNSLGSEPGPAAMPVLDRGRIWL
jgi:hypothetical protein